MVSLVQFPSLNMRDDNARIRKKVTRTRFSDANDNIVVIRRLASDSTSRCANKFHETKVLGHAPDKLSLSTSED